MQAEMMREIGEVLAKYADQVKEDTAGDERPHVGASVNLSL